MIRGKQVLDSGDEVVPEEGLDLRKPTSTAVTKGKLCSWCGKRSISSPNGLVGSSSWSYCSERCYELFRRAVFKKRSACLWCSNSASGGKLSSVANIHSSLDETKFCSEFCLTQFKLKLFCEETTSHLHQIKGKEAGIGGCGKDLITPALWLPKDTPPNISDAPLLLSSGTRIRDGSDPTLTFQPTWRDRSGPPEVPSDNSCNNIALSANQALVGKKEMSPPIPMLLSTQCPTRPLQNVKRLRKGYCQLGKTPASTLLSSRFRSPRPLMSPANSQVGAQMRYAHDESPSSSIGSRHQRHPMMLPALDQSHAPRENPTPAERISIVPVPFPFIFPVLVSTTHASKPLDPIEDLE